ncbi:MAG: hypothetical protein OEY79_02555 [Anaplasmataceae bacterium]|nr:hypothetical protein [Anaplasmataceae bacterium]
MQQKENNNFWKEPFNGREYNKLLLDKIKSMLYPILVYGTLFTLWSVMLCHFIQSSVTSSLNFNAKDHLPMLVLLSVLAGFLIILSIIEQKLEIDTFSKEPIIIKFIDEECNLSLEEELELRYEKFAIKNQDYKVTYPIKGEEKNKVYKEILLIII